MFTIGALVAPPSAKGNPYSLGNQSSQSTLPFSIFHVYVYSSCSFG